MTKNIQDVVPLLADIFLDLEADSTLFNRNQKLVSDNSKRIGLYYKYLGLLHDSWVLKTNITSDKFSITLNDFTTHVFADAIIEKHSLNIEHDKLVFPIQLDFEISDLSFNTVDEEGNIQRIKPLFVDEYLYEQIITVDNKNIAVGLVVWKNNNDNPGQHILILLSAKSILLTEQQDKAWKDLFGDKYNDCFNYFKTQFDKGRYLSDFTKCKELVDEFYRQQN
jgi:hypothetical protein